MVLVARVELYPLTADEEAVVDDIRTMQEVADPIISADESPPRLRVERVHDAGDGRHGANSAHGRGSTLLGEFDVDELAEEGRGPSRTHRVEVRCVEEHAASALVPAEPVEPGGDVEEDAEPQRLCAVFNAATIAAFVIDSSAETPSLEAISRS